MLVRCRIPAFRTHAWITVACAGIFGVSSCGGWMHRSQRPCTANGTKTCRKKNTRSTTQILTIVGTNDVHGRLSSLPWLGGYLEIIRALRRRDGGDVLLLDAGDMFQGTLESNANEGAAMVRAYNALGYDAVAVGNHEFDYGPEGPQVTPKTEADNPRGALSMRIHEAQFPFLVSNIFEKKTKKRWTLPNLKPSTVVHKSGMQIGVIGLLASNGLRKTLRPNVEDLSLTSLKDAVIEQGMHLRKKGCAIVVLVAHTGGHCPKWSDPDDLSSCARGDIESEILDLTESLPKGLIDAVVGGHTHAPVAHRVNGIPVIESFSYGRAFGRIDLTIDKNTRRVVANKVWPPQWLCENHQEADARCQPTSYEGLKPRIDRRVESLVLADLAQTRLLADEVLGVRFLETFTRSGSEEAAVGNWFADMMRAAVPKADMALMNGGGLRSNIPSGWLTYGMLYRLMPFDNMLVSVKLKAAQVKKIIERSLSTNHAMIISVSGVEAEVGCAAGKLRTVLRRPTDDISSAGPIIDDDQVLEVATVDFLLAGGDSLVGVSDLEGNEGKVISYQANVREAVAAHLRKTGGIFEKNNFYNPKKPRLIYSGRRPLRCGQGQSIENITVSDH